MKIQKNSQQQHKGQSHLTAYVQNNTIHNAINIKDLDLLLASHPDIAREILDLHKANIAHTQKMELEVIELEKNSQKIDSDTLSTAGTIFKRGQIFGFIFGLSSLAATIYLAISGQTTIAGIVGGASMVSIVISFITMRKQ